MVVEGFETFYDEGGVVRKGKTRKPTPNLPWLSYDVERKTIELEEIIPCDFH